MKTKSLFSVLGFAVALCLANVGFAQIILSPPQKAQLITTYENSQVDQIPNLDDLLIPLAPRDYEIRSTVTFTGGADGGVYYIWGNISGNGSIIMKGRGTLVLQGNSTYTGGTTITDAGSIIRVKDGALGTGPLTVKDGGKLEFDLGAGATQTVGQISLTNGATLSVTRGEVTLQGTSDGGTAVDISGTVNLSAADGTSLILKGTGSNDNAVGVNVGTDATINSNGDVSIQGIGDGSTTNRHSFRFNGNTNLNAETGSLKVAGQGPGIFDNTAYGMVQNGGGTITTNGNVSIDAASGISSSFSADHSLWRFASTTGALTITGLKANDSGNGECAFEQERLGLKAAAGASIEVNGKAIYPTRRVSGQNPIIIDTDNGKGNVTINSDIKLEPSSNYIFVSGNLTINGVVSGEVGVLHIRGPGGVSFAQADETVTFNGANTFKKELNSGFSGKDIYAGSNQFSILRVGGAGTTFRGGASFPNGHITKFVAGGAVYFDNALYTFPIDVLSTSADQSKPVFTRDDSQSRLYFNGSKLNVANSLTIYPATRFSGDVEIGQTDKTLTFSGTVEGSGALKKTGTGVVVFNNIDDNEYSGTATIEAGALVSAPNKTINVPQMGVVVAEGGKLYASGGSAESVFTVGALTMAAQGSTLDVYGVGTGASRINSASFSAPNGFTINVKNDFAEGDYIVLSSRFNVTAGDQAIPTLGDRTSLDVSKNVCFSWDGNNLLMKVFFLSSPISAASSTPTLCVNTRLTDITHTSKVALGGEISNVRLPSGLFTTAANNVLTISGTPTEAGTFDYSVTIATSGGRCPVVASGTIIVTAANGTTNTGSAASSTAPVCANTPLTAITHTTTGATGVANAGQAGVNGLPVGVSARWADNKVIITGTPPTEGSFTYNIPLTGGCGDVSVTGTITVTSDATGGNSVGAASSTPSLCANTPLTPITHATAGATGVGEATNLPAGVTATWANNAITISGTPTASGIFNYSIPLSGGCGAVSATGKITVSGTDVQVGPPSSTPSICGNSRIIDITHSTLGTGVTGIEDASGLPGTVSATWRDDVVTISGVTGAEQGRFDYTINLTSPCGAFQAKGTIEVVSGPSNGLLASRVYPPTIGSTSTVCVGSDVAIQIPTLVVEGIGTPMGLPNGVTARWFFDGNNFQGDNQVRGRIVISGTTSEIGSFNYKIPVAGGCDYPGNTGLMATGTLTVTESVEGADDGVTARPLQSSDVKLCVNTLLERGRFSYTTTGVTGIANSGQAGVNGLPPGVRAGFSSGNIDFYGIPTKGGIFNFKIPLLVPCGKKFAEGTIMVLSNVAGEPSSTPTLCVNTPMTEITHSTLIAGASGIGTATGLPSGVAATWANDVITISGTPTAAGGTFNYSIPMTFENGTGCGAAVAKGTIIVRPANASRANSAGPASSVSSVCGGSLLTPITHTTSGATGIGTPTGLPTGVTARWANNLVTISGSPTGEARDYSYTIPLTGGCGVVSVSGVIKITPPTGTQNTVTEASSTSTACINTALTPVTHTTTGATGIGAPTRLPAGVTARWANNVITVAGAPTEAGTFNYEIPLAGGCSPTPVIAKGTINVSGIAVVNWASQASSTPTVCVNTALAEITHTTTGATGIGPALGLPNGVAASWANNVIKISGTPTQDGTFAYRIPMTGSCGAVEAMGTITVLKKATVGQASATPTLVINNALPTITHTTTDASRIGNATNLPLGVTASWANNTITISGTPTNAGSFAYSIPVQGCGTESVNAEGRIVITPATAGVPSSNPASAVVNTPITPAITILTNGATGIGTPEGLPPGVTASFDNGVITIGGTPTDDGIYNYRIPLEGGGFVEGTIVVAPAPGGGTPSSNPATVIVNTPITPPITIPADGATGIGTPEGLPPGVTATLNNGVVTVSGTPTQVGTFDYWIPLEGGGFVEGRIVVMPPTASEPSRDPATVPVSKPIEPVITIATQGATGIGTPTGLPPGVTASFANGVITISGTPTNDGTFNYRIPLTGGGFAEGTIIVTPPRGGTPSVNPASVVVNTPLTPSITIPTEGATGIGTPEGLPPGVTATFDNGVVTISGTPTTDGTFDYWIPLAGGGFVEGRIVVTPPVASEPSLNPATVPVNKPMNPEITIATQGATGIETPTGLPPGVTASFANGVITISGTPTNDGTFNYQIPLTGGGVAEGTIIVTPPRGGTPDIDPASVVVNTPLDPAITISTEGATGIGTPEGLPPGVNATFDNDEVTISGVPTADGTFDYWIPLVGGGFVEGRIIVTPATADEPSSNPAYVEVGTEMDPPITISTTGATGIGPAEGLPDGVTASFADGVITLSGTPTGTGTFDYRIPLIGGGFAEGRIISTTPTPPGQDHLPVSVILNTPIAPPISVPTPPGTTIGTPDGLPPGVNARIDENGNVVISGTPTSAGSPENGGAFDYEIPLVPTGSIKGRIIVTPPVAGQPSPNPATVVVNTPLTPAITIPTTGALGIETPVGLPAGVTASFANGVITLTGTPTEQGPFDYRIPLSGGGFADGRIIVTSPTAAEPSVDPVSVTVNTRLEPAITIETQGTDGIGVPIGLPPGVTANFDNGIITLAGSPTVVGSFDYRIPLNGGGFASGTIDVTPATAGTPSPNPATVVVNTPLTPAITIPTTGAAGIGVPEGLPAGVRASFNNGVITISGTPREQGSFDYRIPLIGGGFADGRIIVTSPTAAEPSADPVSLTVNTRLDPPITIATQGTDGIGEPRGLPRGITATWDNGVITLVGNPTEVGSFDYRIPLNGGGFASGTITVTPPTAGTPTPDPATVVVNTPLTPPITIPTTGATGIGTPEGLPPGVTASFDNGVITLSGTPTEQGAFDYFIPLNGGGFADGRIFVTAPTAERPSSDPASVVANEPIAPPITIVTNGTDGIGEPIIGLPPGVIATFDNGVITLSGTPTEEGSFDYRIPLNGGGFATGTINVLVRQSATVAASSPTLCINAEMVAIDMHKTTRATGIGTPTDLPAGLIATWANNTITIKGKPTTAGVFNYKIPLVGGVTAVNATGTITVIGPAIPDVTITGFEDGIRALLTSSATSGNQWFKNGEPIAGATNPTYTVNLRDEFGLTNKELAKDKFTVKVTGEGGCSSQSIEKTLGIVTADEPRNTSRTVVVYPNPVTDQTTVLLAGYEGRKTIALYNLIGEKLSQQQIDGDSAIISLASYPSGTYIVKVAGNNSEKSVLVIKQ